MPRVERDDRAEALRSAAAFGRTALACVAASLLLPAAALADEAALALDAGRATLPLLAWSDAPQLLALNDAAEPRALSARRSRTADPLVDRDADATDAAEGDEAWLEDDFSLDDEFDDMAGGDPLEPMNRGVFAFNRQVDRFMLTPMTDVYQALVPTAGRQGVNNFFVNIDAPVRMTNAMLQGRPKASGIALGRFVLNTTFGLGGLIDVGSRVGLAKQEADFGQTLAKWGTPQGPYLVAPFLGPMTLRHGVGMGVDFVMQPVSYVVGPLPGMIVGAGKDFSRREQHVFELETLRDGSLDFYAALRSAFLQDRADLVAAGAHDSSIAQMADEGSDPLVASLTPEQREARCLAQPRARREWVKPQQRRAAKSRCAAPPAL